MTTPAELLDSTDACVISVLCTLGQPAISALRGVIDTIITALDVQLAQFQAQLALLQIVNTPLALVEEGLQAAVAEIRSVTNLVPLDVIATCLPLGSLMEVINEGIDSATATAQQFLEDLNAKLSLQDEIQAIINLINTALAELGRVVDITTNCTQLLLLVNGANA
jgi:hypothetical protein